MILTKNAEIRVKSFLDKLRHQPHLRKTINQSRLIPHPVRRRIFEILAAELYEGRPYEIKDWEEFKRSMGSFALLLQALHNSNEWLELQKLTAQGEVTSGLILFGILPMIYDLLEDPTLSSLDQETKEEFVDLLAKFQQTLQDTLFLWGRRAEIPLDASFQELPPAFPELEDMSQEELTDQVQEELTERLN